ncbi:hypothetical protein Gohar_024832 [Gossypium harknessii]|uniref:Uncharacterized protein n=1 Tax=Gossypium harknessii TaxID=34285 RepID=A0A7J9HHP2_9ROSI|nr:hypothetical protein [Gossypium harknessii]
MSFACLMPKGMLLGRFGKRRKPSVMILEFTTLRSPLLFLFIWRIKNG